jgi:serine/threonine-protein kinase
MARSADVERRALALVERLLDLGQDEAAQAALLAEAPPAVRDRVTALRASLARSADLLPTRLPDTEPLLEAEQAPEQVGAFRIERRIGSGGMGGVWLAARNDGLYEQTVAVKFIRPGLVTLAGAAFRAERQILARLEHPNIARLIDGGVTADAGPYLVMEYVDGRPIDVAVAECGLRERVRFLVQACEAVQFAHSRLVIHADIKPSNILVDREGRVKLLDFGIARLIGGDPEAGGLPLPMTGAFASPQRLAGQPPTIADDVFALGCVLGDIIGDQPDRELAAVVGKARHADERERYGSVGALIADLERWCEQLPVTAVPSTIGYRTRSFVRRHRAGVMATAGAGLLLAVMAGVATRNAIVADRASAEALARFDDARGAARLVSDELLSQLAERPGTFALRARVVAAVQDYLDRLAASPNAGPEIRLEAAEGLVRLAEAQALPGMPNLDRTEAAMANLAKALALVNGLAGASARDLQVRILLSRARMNCFGRNDIDAALRDLDRAGVLLGSTDGKPDALRARYFIELASALEWKSRYPEAMTAARRAIAHIPGGEARDLVLMRSTALDLLAEAIYYDVDGAQAVAPYRQALTVLTDHEADHPGDQVIARRIARAHWALGSTLAGFGDRKEAIALLAEGTQRAQAIAQADRDDQDAWRMVRILRGAHGLALIEAGQIDAGVALVETNVAERRGWLAQRPDDPQRTRDYLVSIIALGDVQVKHGRVSDGCRTYGEARQLVARIRARGQLTALDLASIVRSLEESLGRHCA